MQARLFVAATAAATLLAPSPAHAWGKTGHRVVASIADAHLSGLARAHIRELLGGAETLDEAANWPDEMRSDPHPFWQKTSTPWHYVTVNGITYDQAPPEGDALQALTFFRRLLQDPKSSLADRQLALRFIVHIVGDLHQPLHVGKCCDRGGNDVKVKWFGRDTNLHAVWDTAIVDEQQLSFTEMTAKLQRHTSSKDVVAWWTANPRDWIAESAQLRDTLYPGPNPKDASLPPELSYAYVYKFNSVVELRLKQAGVRLAAYLNDIYSRPQPLLTGADPR
ncbi:MAG TPA: S1/P1 nuclease [Sphingomicrobium sp.]|nr:S1/P1 nuclease [Sphingomicrobium sp.]